MSWKKRKKALDRTVRGWKRGAEGWFVRAEGGFGVGKLVARLRRLGIAPGDTVMVHLGLEASHGFDGGPGELIEAFQQAVGPEGTLIMMTMPFKGMSAHAWLEKGKVFKVRRTVSKVGIVTEVFRRTPGVLRSVHPTHPVAAWGAQAELFTAPVESPAMFGPDSPFGRLVDVGGKVLLYDVPFKRMTFEHYLEDRMQAHLPCPLYRPEPIEAQVIGHDGERRTMPVLTLTEEVNRRRKTPRLERAFDRAGLLRRGRISLTRLLVAEARPMAEELDRLAAKGWRFHR